MVRIIACLCVSLIASGTAWSQDVLTVERARKSITLSGYTRARTQQTLASEVPGKVQAVRYDVGMTVGRAPFLEIDTTFIDFQIQQVRWTLQKLKVARARGASRADYLQKEFQRIDALHRQDVTTLSRWEAAGEELAQARLALQTTEAEVNAAETQLRELKERRRRHKVFAPSGWIIVQRRVEPGEIVAAGAPLAQAADFTQLVVPLFVSGKELDAIGRLETITVQVEGRPARATINWVNPEFDERTRKSAIELVLADYGGEARGGLLTELTFQVSADGLMVPKAAVGNRYDNPCVVIKESGQSVSVALMGESGDHLLIADQPRLRPGVELQSQATSETLKR